MNCSETGCQKQDATILLEATLFLVTSLALWKQHVNLFLQSFRSRIFISANNTIISANIGSLSVPIALTTIVACYGQFVHG